MKKRLVVVGGHGSGEVAMSVFEAANEQSEEWLIEGYLTDIREPGKFLGNHRVVGGTAEAEDFTSTTHSISTPRRSGNGLAKLHQLTIPPEAHATAIHPIAHIEPSASLGVGVLACAYASTSVGVTIGSHSRLYHHSHVAHDSTVGDYATVAMHSVVGARVVVGEGSHIGASSSIQEDLTIGEYAIIGIGAVVVNAVESLQVVAGNPAQEIGRLKPGA